MAVVAAAVHIVGVAVLVSVHIAVAVHTAARKAAEEAVARTAPAVVVGVRTEIAVVAVQRDLRSHSTWHTAMELPHSTAMEPD